MGVKMRLWAMMAVGLLILVAAGCATAPVGRSWVEPLPQVLPTTAPRELDTQTAAPSLRRGSDGFWYVVGELGEQVQTGAAFLGRYAGEWPLTEMPRPPQMAGRVLARLGRRAALVQILYHMPGADLANLELTWEPALEGEPVGKGVGRVLEQTFGEGGFLTLNLGDDVDVQKGDLYGIFRPVPPQAARPPEPASLMLSRRLVGLCIVREFDKQQARCRQWRGYPGYFGRFEVDVGDEALFLEHAFGTPPNEALIQVGNLAETTPGGTVARKLLLEAFQAYTQRVPSARVRVEALDRPMEANVLDFHRLAADVPYAGQPQMVVGLSAVEREGRLHLVANYNGVGPVTGPGMIAAPPEGGLDLGPLNSPDPVRMEQFAATVLAGVLVYRGQNSEGLMHLHEMLADSALQGPLRWHARDQYAMRWATFGQHEEALWLVQQDEAAALARGDEAAYLNALGTRVRLMEMVELPEKAFGLARTYLERRRHEKPQPPYISALGMYGEMATSAGKRNEARASVRELVALCPQHCPSELQGLLASILWAAPATEAKWQTELLDEIVRHTPSDNAAKMAMMRMYQGLLLMRDKDLEQALIAFLEAERLFESVGYAQGRARAQFFMFSAQLARQEYAQAYDHAVRAMELNRQVGDFEATARILERMGAMYTDAPERNSPEPYVKRAREVLMSSVDAQLARGDYARASEALVVLGTVLLRWGEVPDGQVAFQQGVWYGIRAARFDVVAMCHFYLGMVAHARGDVQGFREEMARARMMAEISGDTGVMELIERALQPGSDEAPPTQFL